MSGRGLQYRVTSGRHTLSVALLVTVACLLVAGLMEGWPPMWPYWCGLPVHILTACVLVGLNHAYGLIRQRASLQSSVYLLLVSLCPALYGLQAGHVAGLAVAGSLFFLFRAYRSPSAPASLFLSGACLGIGALLVPQLVYVLPLYGVGAYSLQAFSPRSFFGLLLGMAFPFWFLLGHAWFYGEMELFTSPFREMVQFGPVFRGFTADQAMAWGYLLVLFLPSVCHVLASGHDDKIHTRCCLRFLVLLGSFLFLAVGLQPSLSADLLPAAAVCVSVTAGRLFVLGRGRVARVFFLLAVWGGAAVFLWNLYALHHVSA